MEVTHEMPRSVMIAMYREGLKGRNLPTSEQFKMLNAMIILGKISTKNACKLVKHLMPYGRK